MGRDFYPRPEGEILSFTLNFSQKISVSPGAYGLSVLQCTHYAATYEAFAGQHAIASNPMTATRGARAAKEEARVALEAETRLLARIVRAQPHVTGQMRIDLGLSAADAGDGGSPVRPPGERPSVMIRSISGRNLHVELRDGTGNRCRKPRGVAGAALFVMLGEEPSANVADWRFTGHTTRARATLTFGAEFPAGAKVWVSAQWFSTRGASGQTSIPVCAYLQGGAAVAPTGITRMAA